MSTSADEASSIGCTWVHNSAEGKNDDEHTSYAWNILASKIVLDQLASTMSSRSAFCCAECRSDSGQHAYCLYEADSAFNWQSAGSVGSLDSKRR
jgi:hypothetical protein